MPVDLCGKYWTISELKNLGFRYGTLLEFIKKQKEVIKVSSVYLVPDSLLPILQKKGGPKDKIAIATAANLCRVSPGLMGKVAEKGFFQDGRIDKKYIPALERAIEEIRQREGKISVIHAEEVARLAMNYYKKETS